jgi:serine/threonine protein kinase
MKTSNILLDEKFNVKVADFGISKLVQPDASHVSTSVQGTLGYLDPEYFRTLQLTDKSDVYGFGMVLLELITSLKPVDWKRGGEDVNLMTKALPFIQNGDVRAIADSRLFNDNSHDDVAVQMQRVAELAITCLAESRYRRPTMKEVVAEIVAIRGDENRPGHDSSDMDHEDVEMVPVLYSQPSNTTSSFEISHALA